LQYLAIGLAGFLGAISRHAVGVLVKNVTGTSEIPWATLFVNTSGSFLIGFLLALAGGRLPVHPELRTIIVIGFVGSYTTFSAFSFETLDLLARGNWPVAFVNAFGGVLVGLLAVYLGLVVGRLA